jgi:hypothetical protein
MGAHAPIANLDNCWGAETFASSTKSDVEWVFLSSGSRMALAAVHILVAAPALQVQSRAIILSIGPKKSLSA